MQTRFLRSQQDLKAKMEAQGDDDDGEEGEHLNLVINFVTNFLLWYISLFCLVMNISLFTLLQTSQEIKLRK